jgi:hypothetical protein
MSQRPTDQLDGLTILACLGGQHAQKLQTVYVMRVDAQNLTIEPLGLGAMAGTMVAHGLDATLDETRSRVLQLSRHEVILGPAPDLPRGKS